MTPQEAALRGRIGAYTLHSRYDPRETTAAARRAFLGRFEEQVDRDKVLSPEERDRRALAARKAYFAKLAYKSAKARKQRAPTKRSGRGQEVVGNGHEPRSG